MNKAHKLFSFFHKLSHYLSYSTLFYLILPFSILYYLFLTLSFAFMNITLSGSAGTAVITTDKALLFTDGRYHNQAEIELGSEWTLMKQGTRLHLCSLIDAVQDMI